MNVLDKQKLLNDITVRYESLKDRIDKDYTGGITSFHEAVRELKYWKESIERGEYDIQIWE